MNGDRLVMISMLPPVSIWTVKSPKKEGVSVMAKIRIGRIAISGISIQVIFAITPWPEINSFRRNEWDINSFVPDGAFNLSLYGAGHRYFRIFDKDGRIEELICFNCEASFSGFADLWITTAIKRVKKYLY